MWSTHGANTGRPGTELQGSAPSVPGPGSPVQRAGGVGPAAPLWGPRRWLRLCPQSHPAWGEGPTRRQSHPAAPLFQARAGTAADPAHVGLWGCLRLPLPPRVGCEAPPDTHIHPAPPGPGGQRPSTLFSWDRPRVGPGAPQAEPPVPACPPPALLHRHRAGGLPGFTALQLWGFLPELLGSGLHVGSWLPRGGPARP